MLAAGAFASLLWLPFATSPNDTQGIFLDGKYLVLDSVILALLAGAGCMIALISIFLFRKRPLQMKLGYVGIVFSILLLAATILFFTQRSETVTVTEIQEGPGLLMPLSSIIFLAIALYFIRKDEHIVKSMDRLR